LLALQPWPKLEKDYLDDGLEMIVSQVFDSIRVARNLRAVAGLKPSQTVPIRFITAKTSLAVALEDAKADIKALTRANQLEILDPMSAAKQPSARSLAGVSGELQVLLPIEGLVDLDALRARLEKDITKADKEIANFSHRLANPNFAEKAPEAVVAECRANLAEVQAQAGLARKRLLDLE